MDKDAKDLREAERKFQGVCPFCGEDDFDLGGLKFHLVNGWCPIYELVPTFERIFARR